MPYAEIITLPYPLLLHPKTRHLLGIDLKGHVVIVDEAHNLGDAIAGLFSLEVTHNQCLKSLEQLKFYLEKFGKLLRIDNKVMIQRLVLVIKRLSQFLQTSKQDNQEISISTIMTEGGLDQINLNPIIEYMWKSKLAEKVDGYVKFKNDSVPEEQRSKLGRPVLSLIHNFLVTMMNPSKEGRFFVKVDSGQVRLVYLLLDQSDVFRSVIDDARAVILAGGTMSPVDITKLISRWRTWLLIYFHM